MLLMAVGGAPPTLFRERDDEDALAAPGLPWRQRAKEASSWDPFLICTVLLSGLTQSSIFSQLVRRFVTIGSIEACIALIGRGYLMQFMLPAQQSNGHAIAACTRVATATMHARPEGVDA